MFSAIRRLKIKIKVVVYLLILVILSLLVFGIYVKVRGVQSVNFMEHQAASTSDISIMIERISTSLSGIEEELAGLREETCLARNGEDC